MSIQAQIINLLEDLQAKFGLTYLFIAHDLSVVEHISTRVAVMYLGKIVEIGDADKIYARPAHPYTRKLLEAVPVPDADVALKPASGPRGETPSPANPPSGCRFRTRCPLAVARCADEAPAAHHLSPTHRSLCHFSTP